MVAMDAGGHGDPVPPGLHELQHRGLPQHVLKHHAIGPQREVTLAGFEILTFRIVEMTQQDFVGQGERLCDRRRMMEILRSIVA